MRKALKIILWAMLGILANVALIAVAFVAKMIETTYDGHPAGTTFYVREDEGLRDGRILEIYHQDSAMITHPGHPVRICNAENLYRPDSAEAKVEPFLTEEGACPVAVHRYQGRVDTLYTAFHGHAGVGYVSRWRKTGDWIVVECKVPGEIMEHDCLAGYGVAVNRTDTCPPIRLALEDYSYKGQTAVFESKMVHYWIAGRKTADLYGPLTEQELVVQAKILGIRLPIKLDGNYDRYVRNYSHEKEPKAFSWPNHRERPDKVVGK